MPKHGATNVKTMWKNVKTTKMSLLNYRYKILQQNFAAAASLFGVNEGLHSYISTQPNVI
jgi:hypothetical protein